MDRPNEPSQLPTAVITLETMTSYRRIEEAFHCKLKGPVVVDKKTLAELQNFQTVSADSKYISYIIMEYLSIIMDLIDPNFILHKTKPKQKNISLVTYFIYLFLHNTSDKCIFNYTLLYEQQISFYTDLNVIVNCLMQKGLTQLS